jgi:methyltransferase domain protein
MRLLEKPTTKEAIIAIIDSNLKVEHTNSDGTTFIVPSEEYLEQKLLHIEGLGFFRK